MPGIPSGPTVPTMRRHKCRLCRGRQEVPKRHLATRSPGLSQAPQLRVREHLHGHEPAAESEHEEMAAAVSPHRRSAVTWDGLRRSRRVDPGIAAPKVLP